MLPIGLCKNSQLVRKCFMFCQKTKSLSILISISICGWRCYSCQNLQFTPSYCEARGRMNENCNVNKLIVFANLQNNQINHRTWEPGKTSELGRRMILDADDAGIFPRVAVGWIMRRYGELFSSRFSILVGIDGILFELNSSINHFENIEYYFSILCMSV